LLAWIGCDGRGVDHQSIFQRVAQRIGWIVANGGFVVGATVFEVGRADRGRELVVGAIPGEQFFDVAGELFQDSLHTMELLV
jgi:hypothetical protein